MPVGTDLEWATSASVTDGEVDTVTFTFEVSPGTWFGFGVGSFVMENVGVFERADMFICGYTAGDLAATCVDKVAEAVAEAAALTAAAATEAATETDTSSNTVTQPTSLPDNNSVV